MKWNVHYGIRFTKDFEIEADSFEEAIDKVENTVYDIPVSEMEYADDDWDIWEVEEI